MQTTARPAFPTVRSEGALLPAELLGRVAARDGLAGLRPEDYHLAPGERLNEAITRSWNRCLGAWRAFDAARRGLAEGASGTTLTRERWLLILFQELGYGRLQAARGVAVAGVSYPLSHLWSAVPIHLVSFRQDLDRRGLGAGPGLGARSPHSLVQEYLNRAPALWGFLSNGLHLRLLRDNASLTRLAYVELDLEALMTGERYSDFALLWLVAHQSRVEGEDPAACWLEKWSQTAAEQGVRALEVLREGVREAIAALGAGFLAHPANGALRERLRSGELGTQDYYRQLLRLVYRLIFLFVAEDRELLQVPGAPVAAVAGYGDHYSARRLRQLAAVTRGGPHADLYRALTLVAGLLRGGYSPLGLPALGGFLFSDRATPDLDGAELANQALLKAVRALAFVVEGRVLRPVDYRNLGAEELGSVYESLLELHPALHVDAGGFTLDVVAGSERKTSGSHYTPASLIQCLLDSALEPVVAERLAAAKAAGQPTEAAILAIRVLDKACGSGHFLIAAAHRLARHLARARTGDEEPAPEALRQALRDVVRRCIHGVDLNEMAVELCKVSLWLETLEPGKPLSFLDANIQCGNSLLGATPRLLAEGIPDAAFTPIEGDDKVVCADFKKRNKQQRAGQRNLFAPDLTPWDHLGNLAAAMMALDDTPDDSVEAVRRKEARYADLVRGSAYRYGQLLADAWCAAFVMPKTRAGPYPITEEVFRRIEHNPHTLEPALEAEVRRLAAQYRFFHWHLAFPQVFRVPGPNEDPDNEESGWSGGFDVVVGNPPWERVKLQEQEWFAARDPRIAKAPNAAARKRLIAALASEDPSLHRAFLADRRQAEGHSHLIRNSGRYPLCGVGDVNTYAVFAELATTLIAPDGRCGIIVPTGIATDFTTAAFFASLAESGALASLYDFENEEKLFPGVDHRVKFCLLTAASRAGTGTIADLAFFLRRTAQLRDEWRHFTLTGQDFALLNPNTRTCPVFRSRRDAEITKGIHRRVPVLLRDGPPVENPWGVSFMAMLHMANDSSLFRTAEQLTAESWRLDGNTFRRGDETYVPLYEAKMVHHFDHRFGTYLGQTEAQANVGTLPTPPTEQYADPTFVVQPRYWVPAREVEDRLAERWERGWLLGWRDICRPTDQRTVIASVVPRVGVGDKFLLMMPDAPPSHVGCLLANLDVSVLDYVARQKLGGTSLKYFTMKQLPLLPPTTYSAPCPWSPADADLAAWILPRVLELTYTAWDLAPFARDCGYEGPPFRWDEGRRFQLRCELDAAFFHLYGIGREDVDYIMDTFPIVRRKDEAVWGEYRTKRVVLEVYDAMAAKYDRWRPEETPPLPSDGVDGE